MHRNLDKNDMAKVSVVILNYNGRHFLEQFLDGVINHSGDAEIIVADNCSTDDSLDYLRKHHPSVRVIVLEENYGFSGGYNHALKQIVSDYYVILNSDVEVTSRWLAPAISYMDEHSEVAACQPKILAYHDKTKFEYAGAAGGYIDLLGYPFCRGRLFQSLEKDEGQYNDLAQIFWATGACLFIRAKVFHEAGGFDEDYFAHMEEIDLCWRINISGHKIMYIPQSTVYHVGGGTLPKENPRKTYLNFHNSLATLYKNTARRSLWWKLLLRFALDAVAALKFLLRDGFDSSLAVVRANYNFYSQLNKYHKKRKAPVYKNGRKIHLPYRRLLIVDYYLKGKKKYSDLLI